MMLLGRVVKVGGRGLVIYLSTLSFFGVYFILDCCAVLPFLFSFSGYSFARLD